MAEFPHRFDPATLTYFNVTSGINDITLSCVWIENPNQPSGYAPPPPSYGSVPAGAPGVPYPPSYDPGQPYGPCGSVPHDQASTVSKASWLK